MRLATQALVPVVAATTRVALWGDDLEFRRAGVLGAGLCASSCVFTKIDPQSVEQARGVLEDFDVLFAEIRNGRKVDISRVMLNRSSLSHDVIAVSYWREAVYGKNVQSDIQVLFNLSMGVHFDSSIVNPAYWLGEKEHESDDVMLVNDVSSNPMLRPFDERDGFAVYVTSHCDQQPRTDYVDILATIIDLDYYGRCPPVGNEVPRYQMGTFHNAFESHRTALQVTNASRYKFYLSMENHVGDGYVTEKLLSNPLRAGAVPVYLGAPNADRLPSIDGTGRPWFINVWDFESPQHLADYLGHVAANDTLWHKYVDWHGYFFKHGKEGLFPNATRPIRELLSDGSHFVSPKALSDNIPAFKQRRIKVSHRRVNAVCRLCNLTYLNDLARIHPLLPRVPPLEETDWRPRLFGEFYTTMRSS
ncbi:hypothetical protein CTAYLR_001926 [Chrysophaeum taylorii]|uniref:Fucosyltransferase n=1 Tax=Chrysophaeum taylorii TaxID=2483200 RepID=A0AAD7U8K8_9STRA|nr:hypothetical protein CTAYLR_001926 [Chrysophaeum taylorii]